MIGNQVMLVLEILRAQIIKNLHWDQNLLRLMLIQNIYEY